MISAICWSWIVVKVLWAAADKPDPLNLALSIVQGEQIKAIDLRHSNEILLPISLVMAIVIY